MAEPALKTITASDFELFQAQYLEHYMTVDSAVFHREWDAALVDKSIQFLCIEAGRGGAKTTKASVNYALYEICEGTDPTGFMEFQICSRSADDTGTAAKIMAKVKRELETNELLIYDYGITRGETWGKKHIQVKRADGMTVDFYSVGKHSSVRGSRGTILIDDPQNSADCRSETVLAADDDWFLTDVLPIVIQKQRLIFIGTPISPVSLCSKVKAMKMFTVISSPMEDENGNSCWPELYPNEFLAERRDAMGIDRYAGEYLCRPMVSENPMFRDEWFPDYNPETVQFDRLRKEGFYIAAGMDCAESKRDQADNSAIVVLAATYDEVPDIYVMLAKAGHWSTKEGASYLVRAYEDYKWNRAIVESRVKSPSKDAMVEEIEDLERIESVNVNLRSVRPEKDKVTRAMMIQSLCQQGRVHINHRDAGQAALLNELIMFTGDQIFHDDRVDAFVYALDDIKRNFDGKKAKLSSGPDVPKKRRKFSHSQVRPGY